MYCPCVHNNNKLTEVEVKLEVGGPTDPAGVLVGDVASVLASVRQTDVGDLEKSGRHYFHPVIKNNGLQRIRLYRLKKLDHFSFMSL